MPESGNMKLLRIRHGILGLVVFIFSWGLSSRAALADGVSRDWKTYRAIVVTDQPPQIYGIGDIHGDYEKVMALMVGAKIIKAMPDKPENVQWALGKGLLVCTGDMIDKGPKSVEVLQFMRALQASAQNAGGRVIVTLGNHEAEFLAAGGKDKKAADFETELQAMKIDPAAVAAGTDADGLGSWLRTRPFGAKVGDWFFCHAGNTGGSTVEKLETDIEAGVNKDGFGTFVLAEPNSMLEARLAPVPWWITASLAEPPTKKLSKKAAAAAAAANEAGNAAAPAEPIPKDASSARLVEYIHALGCQHLVMGHQPGNVNFGGGVQRKASEPFAYEGILFLMDVGMSRGTNDGHAIVLKIETGTKPSVATVDSGGIINYLWTGE
jgi:nucleotide-binding universal stress UspA family protein